MTLFLDNRRSGNGHRQRGTSLVEVLVALVLLVIGIYSIARLFPGGFFSIRGAQDATFADRLAQGQIEQLKENSAFLLDAVYMYEPNGTFDPSVLPTDYNDDFPSVSAPNSYYRDIDKARYVSGETFNVGAPNVSTNVVATNGVSLYVLNDGPALLNTTTNPPSLAGPAPLPASPSPVAMSPANVYGLPQVHSGPWTAHLGTAPTGINSTASPGIVSGSSDDPNDVLNSGGANYVIDYTNQQIAIPAQANYAQPFTFVVKQTWSIPGGAYTPPTTEVVTYYYPLVLPAAGGSTGMDTPSNYNGGWFNPLGAYSLSYLDTTRPVVTDVPQPTANGATITGWVPGSAQLIRTMTLESNPGVMTGSGTYAQANQDPYNYALYSSSTTLPGVSGATFGVLAVNPRLQGQTVSVSYLVYDWHIIHEDDDVPASDGNAISSPIHLTIDHLKRVGDVQNDQSLYPGLFQSADASSSYDIVVLDTDTGQTMGLSAPAVGTAPAGNVVYDLDNNDPRNTPVQGGQFVVSYQNGYVTLPTAGGTPATDPWTSVTHQHVRIYYEGDNDWAVALQKAPSLYALGSNGLLSVGQYAVVTSGGTVHLHFPPCDQGQTIEIDDVRYTDTNGNVQDASSVTGSITTDYADTNYVDLGGLLPNADLTKAIQIGAVRGVSARSVVIWKERDQWRSRSVNTILTGNE